VHNRRNEIMNVQTMPRITYSVLFSFFQAWAGAWGVRGALFSYFPSFPPPSHGSPEINSFSRAEIHELGGNLIISISCNA
jgi:hypothetical protein